MTLARWSSPEHIAEVESLTGDQVTSISVGSRISNEHYALGKTKAESINIRFLNGCLEWLLQFSLKCFNKLPLLSNSSKSADITERFICDLKNEKESLRKKSRNNYSRDISAASWIKWGENGRMWCRDGGIIWEHKELAGDQLSWTMSQLNSSSASY